MRGEGVRGAWSDICERQGGRVAGVAVNGLPTEPTPPKWPWLRPSSAHRSGLREGGRLEALAKVGAIGGEAQLLALCHEVKKIVEPGAPKVNS